MAATPLECTISHTLIKATDTKEPYILLGRTKDSFIGAFGGPANGTKTPRRALMDAEYLEFLHEAKDMLLRYPDGSQFMPMVSDALKAAKIDPSDLKLLPCRYADDVVDFSVRLPGKYEIFFCKPNVFEMTSAELEVILRNMTLLASTITAQHTSIIKGLGLGPIDVKTDEGTKTLQPTDRDYLPTLRNIRDQAAAEGKSLPAHDKRMVALVLLDPIINCCLYTEFIAVPFEPLKTLLLDASANSTVDVVNAKGECVGHLNKDSVAAMLVALKIRLTGYLMSDVATALCKKWV
jgi:hypothetical protein